MVKYTQTAGIYRDRGAGGQPLANRCSAAVKAKIHEAGKRVRPVTEAVVNDRVPAPHR
jgi:hypothetical protein